jgi:hypothetical protein
MPLELPFTSDPNYRVSAILDGTTYVFDVRWNAGDSSWYFDVLTQDAKTILATGVRIVLGQYLGRHKWTAPFTDGVFVAHDLSGARKEAGIDDLGSRVVVRFYSNLEVAQIRNALMVLDV